MKSRIWLATVVPLEMVHDRPVGEIAVEGEVARDTFGNDPINQVLRQIGMALKRMGVIALLALAEAPQGERIVLAARIDVGDEQIVVGNQVTHLGVIPEVADVLDQFAVVVNQGVVNWDDAILAITGGRVVLEPFETVVIQAVGLPG